MLDVYVCVESIVNSDRNFLFSCVYVYTNLNIFQVLLGSEYAFFKHPYNYLIIFLPPLIFKALPFPQLEPPHSFFPLSSSDHFQSALLPNTHLVPFSFLVSEVTPGYTFTLEDLEPGTSDERECLSESHCLTQYDVFSVVQSIYLTRPQRRMCYLLF